MSKQRLRGRHNLPSEKTKAPKSKNLKRHKKLFLIGRYAVISGKKQKVIINFPNEILLAKTVDGTLPKKLRTSPLTQPMFSTTPKTLRLGLDLTLALST